MTRVLIDECWLSTKCIDHEHTAFKMKKTKKRLFKRKSHVNKCMIIQTFHQSYSLEPCTAKLDKFLLSAAKSEKNCILESWYNYLRLTMLGGKTFEIDENTQTATWRPRDTSFAFGAFAIVSNIHIRRTLLKRQGTGAEKINQWNTL